MKSAFIIANLLSDIWARLLLGGGDKELKDPEWYRNLRYSPTYDQGNGSAALKGFQKIDWVESYRARNGNLESRQTIINKLQSRDEIKKWLTPKEIEILFKSEKTSRSNKSLSEPRTPLFDPYFWTEDGGKTWKDLYPFVRPDVGWWMTQKISDYTVRISYNHLDQLDPRLHFGTGWFLDFVEPEGKAKYPTKWYLATNAHVVDDLRLGRDPYKQGSPENCIRLWWNVAHCAIDREVTLYKDARMDSNRMPVTKDPFNVWSYSLSSHSYSTSPSFEDSRRDRFIEAGDRRDTLDSVPANQYPIFKTVLKDVDLFYFPKDFMTFSDGANHAVDMVVLEVEFEDELSARRLTSNLYNKYYSEKAYGVPLNFLSDKAEEPFLKSSNSEHESFFSLGYPYDSPSQFRAYGNYSQTTRLASTPYSVYGGDNFGMHAMEWADADYTRSKDVYMYGLVNYPLSKGASGSMVVDVSGNVLGLISLGIPETSFGFVSPLRNLPKSEYRSVDLGRKVTKRSAETNRSKTFDLISGEVEGQKNSYADALKTHGKKTYLSNTHGWLFNSKNKYKGVLDKCENSTFSKKDYYSKVLDTNKKNNQV